MSTLDGRFRDPRAEPEPLRRYLETTLRSIDTSLEWIDEGKDENPRDLLDIRDLSREHFDAFSVSYSLGEPAERLRHHLAGAVDAHVDVDITLSHPRPYGRLITAVQAEPAARPRLVGQFVQHWYNGTRKRQGWGEHLRQQKRGVAIQYPGYWCFTGTALTKLLDVDDSGYRDSEYYPEAFLPR